MAQIIIRISLILILSGFRSETVPKIESDFTLYVFEGSDWCPNCLQLKRLILSSDLFSKGLEEHNIQVEMVDFPQRKKIDRQTQLRNDSLATVYNFDGTFPTLILSRSGTMYYDRIVFRNQSAQDLLDEIINKADRLHE